MFVDISGGLHASEIAGSQHTIQLAYDLLSRADEPKTKAILDNTVLFLWPSINPDGQNIVVNWYRENVGTPYEVSPLHELYQKYIGHDNNRDAYMLNVVESRVVARTWREWEPQIIYVQHQSSPFPTRIWLPPFAEPIAPRVPALMSRQVNTIGMTIAQALESNGQVGATHMGTGFDAWYPGYIDYMPMLQNINAYWTETALYRYATPHFYTLDRFPAPTCATCARSRCIRVRGPAAGGACGMPSTTCSRRPSPRSITRRSIVRSCSTIATRRGATRSSVMRPSRPTPTWFRSAQRDPGARGRDAAPPRVQRRSRRAARPRRRRTTARSTSEGSWVIPMDQEFAELVRQLFDVQEYPDLREYPEGPPEQPYDAAGWTLPFQMDVNVVEVRTPLSR